jgi:hypothetical protein
MPKNATLFNGVIAEDNSVLENNVTLLGTLLPMLWGRLLPPSSGYKKE